MSPIQNNPKSANSAIIFYDLIVEEIKIMEGGKQKIIAKIMQNEKSQIIIYKTEDGKIAVDALMKDESLWLNAHQMATLFEIDRSGIVKHIKKIYETGELEPNSTCAIFAQVAKDGKMRDMDFYNLDAIISVGYRVNSLRGIQFRSWATARLKEYIVKGFVMDDDRLKNLGSGGHWKELLERIRDIRSSEKVFYRQILDIYATSIDYDANTKISNKKMAWI